MGRDALLQQRIERLAPLGECGGRGELRCGIDAELTRRRGELLAVERAHQNVVAAVRLQLARDGAAELGVEVARLAVCRQYPERRRGLPPMLAVRRFRQSADCCLELTQRL